MSNIVETGNDQNFENFIYSAFSTPFSPAICNISKAKVSYNKFADNFTKMSNMRVIQKHLVYVIGLSANLAFKEVKNLFFIILYILNLDASFKIRIFRTIWKNNKVGSKQE